MAGPPRLEAPESDWTTPWWQQAAAYPKGTFTSAGQVTNPAGTVTREDLRRYLDLRRRVTELELALTNSEQDYQMQLAAGVPVKTLVGQERGLLEIELAAARDEMRQMEQTSPALLYQQVVNPQAYNALINSAVTEFQRSGDYAAAQRQLDEIRQKYNVQPGIAQPAGTESWLPWAQKPAAAATAPEAGAPLAGTEPTIGVDVSPPAYGNPNVTMQELQSWTPEQQQYFVANQLGMPTPWQKEQAQQLQEQNWYNNALAYLRMQQDELQAQRNWQQAQAAQAMRGYEMGFGWQVPKGVEYIPGLEPGGVAAQWAGALGVPFNAEGFRNVDYPAPQMGAMPQPSEYQRTLQAQLEKVMPLLTAATMNLGR